MLQVPDAEDHGRGCGSVVRESGVEVGEEDQAEGPQRRRDAGGEQQRQKDGIHCQHVCRDAGESVVAEEVDQYDDNEHSQPSPRGHGFADHLSKFPGQPLFADRLSQPHQPSIPNEDVPSVLLAHHVFPRQHAAYQQAADADQRHRGCFQPVQGPRGPKKAD